MRKCNARHTLLALSALLVLVGTGLLLLPACRREPIPEPKALRWALGTPWPEAEDFYPDLAEGATVSFASDRPFPNSEKTMMTKSYETTLVYRTAGGRSGKKTATVDVTVDQEPPVISGVRVIAVSVGEAVAYRDGVTVTDDCDGPIELTVDDSKVDLETVGEYPVTYTATDRTGKWTTVESKVNVYDNKISEEMLWEKLDPIIEKEGLKGLSKVDQVQRIWEYVHDRNHIRYDGTSDKGDWVRGAYDALEKRAGDCFTYYSLSKAFFERLGIGNMDIFKAPDSGDAGNSHYWSMVNIGTEANPEWYYYDATRVDEWIKAGYETYLLTDSQMRYLKSKRPDLYGTDLSGYPKTGTREYVIID